MANCFRDISHRKREMTWQKWVTRQRWMDPWDPGGGWIISDSMDPCLPKTHDVQGKEGPQTNTWRVLTEVFYMWPFSWKNSDMFNGRVQEVNFPWKLGMAFVVISCHLSEGPEEVWERNSTLRLEYLELVVQDVEVEVELKACLFSVTPWCIIYHPSRPVFVWLVCVFFLGGEKKSSPEELYMKMIRWFELMRWEPSRSCSPSTKNSPFLPHFCIRR